MVWMLAGMLLLNLMICLWNCYAIGKSWIYTRQIGGFAHIANWMGYLMTVAGLCFCILIPEALIAREFEWISARAAEVLVKAGYVVFGGVIVFAGLFVWVDSVAHAVKDRSLTSVASAGWNSFAQASNMIDYARNVQDCSGDVLAFFSSDDGHDDNSHTLVALLFLLAVAGGWLIAHAITSHLVRRELLALKHGRA